MGSDAPATQGNTGQHWGPLFAVRWNEKFLTSGGRDKTR